jgi:hypothetical protein
VPDQPCGSCRQILTDDPSGLCEDCQADVLSRRPASITAAQRDALIGLMTDQGIAVSRHARGELLARVVPRWKPHMGGDLGYLSQQEAGDVLEHLEERRLSQEARNK